MQNQYVGDVGDYVKFALLRALCFDHKLGIAWYLFPDEPHKGDGRHISYLNHADEWEAFDPDLFSALCKFVKSGKRNINAIACANLIASTTYADEALQSQATTYKARAEWRDSWFARVLNRLSVCDVVFADPDNGPKLDNKYRSGTRIHWKSIPLKEILALSAHRTVIVYFHNTRTKGGHAKENRRWLSRLPKGSIAVYCRAFSCRTFFIINPTNDIRQRAVDFVQKWHRHVDLIP
ncbi:MAG: hypothetical protein PHD48_09670 [Alphaproteobacteria bacterium]|nr:hypothetical protein [Alphaproteobacteria bacterium]